MNYILAAFAGILQGITEFLPISSSGHLVIFHDLFKFNLPNDLFFDVVLHLGTLVAIIVFFYRDIEKIIRGFFSSLANWNLKNNFNQRLAWLVILATIPAALAGYFLEDFINRYFRSAFSVAIMLIVVGLIFFISEKYAKRQKDLQAMNFRDAIIVGLLQIFALIPGVSRSGITIIAGLGRKLKREEAARFSFLISAPIIFGAGLKTMFNIDNWAGANLAVLVLGFISSAVFGYLAIRFMIQYLSRHSLNAFAWYRLIIGCLVLAALLFFGR
ncbi:MAG: undecaprenyl-diphosphatase UppP [Patescibacteria group bacterium]